MFFWSFMLVSEIIIPITMIGFGKYFLKQAPKDINVVFGYRTRMSMKNKDTWIFSHKYVGKVWYISGLVLLPISIVIMLFLIGKSEDMIGIVGGVLSVVQLLILIGAIIPTERALKKNFDKNGKRISYGGKRI